MDGSGEDTDAPAWLRTLPATAHAYGNSDTEAERVAAGASLRQIAGSEALRQAPPTIRLSAMSEIAEAYFTRNMRTGEAAALDSAVAVGLDMAEDARAQFGASSCQAAAAITAAGFYLANRALDLSDPADAERAVALLREAQDTGAVPPGSQFRLLYGLGAALWARYARSRDARDLDQCISMWDPAKDVLPEDSSDRPGCLRNLAVALRGRFSVTGDRADIGRAVGLLEQAVAATPPGSPQLSGRQRALLEALGTHFDATSQPADLDRMAILLKIMARDASPPLRRRYQAQLASVLDDKVSYFGGSLDDLWRAVDALETAVAEIPADDPELAEYQAHLAMALHQVSEPDGDLELANRAAALAAGALDATALTSPRWPVYARDLAVILSGRARKTRNRDDVEEAIRLLQRIDMASWAGPDAYLPRVSLGHAFLLRFQLGGAARDLDRAVELMDEAVSHTSPMTPQRLVARRSLARVLQARHAVTGNPDDVARLSSLQQESGHVPDPAPGHARDAQNLFEEYEATGDLSALDGALAELAGSLAAMPTGSPERFNVLLNMGLLLWRKHERTGDISCLNQAILIYEGLLAECPHDSTTFARAQVRRGMCLRDRYVRMADLTDLNSAITDYREVLRSPNLRQPLKYEVYSNLGLALWDLYWAAGNLEDLENAIAAAQAGVGLPGFSQQDDSALNTLGLALRDRYPHSEDPQDLAGAVEAHEQALALTLPASPRYGARLNSLGGTYFFRWFHARDIADLDRAIRAYEQASAADEPGHASRLRSLADLAACLRQRYIKVRAPADLDRAVAMAEAAIAEAPAGSTESKLYLNHLADALRTRYDQMGQRSDLQRAIHAYRDSCAYSLDARPATALEVAERWCGWASGRGAWDEAAEAGEFAISAMVGLFQNQYGRPHKESWLAVSRGVPALAAYALAMAGEAARAAVALESGRTMLLSEALRQDRADLDALRALGHGGLADRYLQAAERWRRLLALAGQRPDSQPQTSGTASPLPGPAAGTSAETGRFMTSWQHGEQLRAARSALDGAIAAIRSISGHERFLQPPGIEDIRAAAGVSPLVYLAAAEHGGMAVIVRPPADGDHVREIPLVIGLPELTAGEVSRWARTLRDAHERRDDQPAWRGALDAVTARLWTAVMGPVTEALDGAETAVLIPAGQLVMLPLHAAWTADAALPGGRRYAADETCLSYAPSAASLSAAAAVAASATADSLLLVEEPRPGARGPLPFAGAEAAAAAAHFRHVTALRHEDATVNAVLGALDGCSAQHFACHAVADLAAPLDSALILAGDKPLTLRQILGQPPGRAAQRLAVLAACETQVPGQRLPDEVISLPAGLIQAGAAGVIASQWAVPGLATAMLMTRFYQYWKHDQLPPAAALRAAQRWLRDTTNGEKADYFKTAMRDAPGPAPDGARTLWRAIIRKTPADRSHAHISEWAAFVHTGA